MTWVKDDRAEAFLRRLGTDYIYETEIPMKTLSESWDVNNASRPGKPIIDEAVSDYEERIRNGESPPAVIVIFRPDGSVFPLDGRQRLSAAKRAGWTVFNAYVLDEATKKSHVELIEIGANTSTNGSAPVDKNYIYSRAAHLHHEYDISIKQIAQDLSIRESGIRDHITYTGEVAFLKKHKLPADAFNKGMVMNLADLNREWWEKAPDETREVTMIFHKSKQTNGKVSSFVDRANRACKGKASRVTQMRGFKRELLSDSTIMGRLAGAKKRGPDTKVIEHARKLRTVALEAKRAGVMLDAKQTEELVSAMAEARQYLQFIVTQGTPV